jgi:hypothetical protein
MSFSPDSISLRFTGSAVPAWSRNCQRYCMGCVPGSVGCLGRLDQIVNKTGPCCYRGRERPSSPYSYRYFFGSSLGFRVDGCAGLRSFRDPILCRGIDKSVTISENEHHWGFGDPQTLVAALCRPPGEDYDGLGSRCRGVSHSPVSVRVIILHDSIRCSKRRATMK